MIKIGFFGTPHLSKMVLKDLHNNPNFQISFVVTGTDKPVGRSQTLTLTPVKEFAIDKNTPIFTPVKIKNNTNFFEQIKNYEVDYFVVVAYGKILPKEVLEMPRKLCINVHGSILPHYRGASPIQSVLINGEKETGVTIMKMSEGMDEGDIIDILPIMIDKFDTTETLFKKFEEVSGKFLAETIMAFDKGEKGFISQDSKKSTYCKKITKEDGKLDFNRTAESLFYLWRGLTPWPGVYTFFEGKKLIITKCDYILHPDPLREAEREGKIGEVIKGDFGIGIKCSKGVLVLQEVKMEGKGNQRIEDFVNGRRKFVGCNL